VARRSKNRGEKNSKTAGSPESESPTRNRRESESIEEIVDQPDHVDNVPKSVTYMWINCLAFAITVLLWFILHDNYEIARRHLALLCVVVYGLFVIVLETLIYKVYRRASTGHNYDNEFTPDLFRIAIKTVGFYITISIVALFFFVFEIYRRPFFDEFWLLGRELLILWPVAVLFQFIYFFFSDGYQTQPKDSYWMLGKIFLGDTSVIDRQILGQHFLGWLVKAFFLPIMFKYLIDNFYNLNFSWRESPGFIPFYDFAFTAMFTVDLLITCAGYMLTFKVLDSHIRSTEPTMLGWCVALAGYYPFWDTISSAYLPYNDGMYWGHMTHDSEIYGWFIIAAVLIYIWATVAFGIRFSNLTHRGVLTNGPYRFCKHPAYVSKNLSWWLISVPFWMHENSTMSDVIRHCIMLFGVNCIYFMRARTEERHLSWDPDYVAYALWMNDHGAFAWLGRIFPLLRYRPPMQPVIRGTTVSSYIEI